VETICLEAYNQCYEFEIKDNYGDGMNEGGNFKIYYDDVWVNEGGEFESSETIKFGDACPTPAPITSLRPSASASASPSVSPTELPSDIPTLSEISSVFSTLSKSPTESPTKTFSPTLSWPPTITPTSANIDQFIGKRPTDGRRQFPYVLRPDDGKYKFNRQPAANCSEAEADGRVGCVGIPRTYAQEKRLWSGKLHFTPPKNVKSAKMED